jgi:protein farnesyltransferase/geranylgeranyltransferase type-1 subunit alpha
LILFTAKQQAPTTAPQPPKEPQTIRELEWQNYWLTNPLQKIVEEQGFTSLNPADTRTYFNLLLVRTSGQVDKLSKKGVKELWKQLSDANIPLRAGSRPTDNQWGRDKNGRDIGNYTLDEYAAYKKKESKLTDLRLESYLFNKDRSRAHWKTKNHLTSEIYTLAEDDIKAEKQRRQDMAILTSELYGETTGRYEIDPEWDDVVPIPQ